MCDESWPILKHLCCFFPPQLCTPFNTLRKLKELWYYQRIFVAEFLQAFLFPESLYYKDLWCSFSHPPCYLSLHSDEKVMSSWTSRLSHPLLTRSGYDPLFRLWMQWFLFVAHLAGDELTSRSRSSSMCSLFCSPLIFCSVSADYCSSLGFLLNQALLIVCGLVGWPGSVFLFDFFLYILSVNKPCGLNLLNFIGLFRKLEDDKTIAQINVHVGSDWCLLFSSWFGQFLTQMFVV